MHTFQPEVTIEKSEAHEMTPLWVPEEGPEEPEHDVPPIFRKSYLDSVLSQKRQKTAEIAEMPSKARWTV